MLRNFRLFLATALFVGLFVSPGFAIGPDGAWLPGPETTVRHGPTATYDPLRDRMIVIGGNLLSTDVLVLSFQDTAASWSVLPTVGVAPSPRYEQTAVYDSWRDRIIVFGGLDASGVRLNDAWALNLSGTPAWQELVTQGAAPPARYAHVAVFRPVSDEMIIHGGEINGAVLTGDVWSLSLADTPTWTQLAPGGTAPSPRSSHTAAYDDVSDQMIIYGGDIDPGVSGDVWTLALSGANNWAQVTPTGPPPARYAHTAIWDGYRGRMVVFGGGETLRDDTWELDMAGTPEWHQLFPQGPVPSARYTHTAVFDGARDRMVVFGGGGAGDTWFLDWHEFACKPLFGPRYSALSDSASAPGTPVVYNATDVLVSREPGCTFRLTGECGMFAPWIVADKVYFDGVPVGGFGFSGVRGLPFEAGVPIQLLLFPTPARLATNRIGLGPRQLRVTLAETQRSIYGSSALYLVKDTTPFASAVTEPRPTTAGEIRLLAAPNPTQGRSQIRFSSSARPLRNLVVVDVKGRVVRVFRAAAVGKWNGQVDWNGRDDHGRPVASGVYYAVADDGHGKATARLVVSR